MAATPHSPSTEADMARFTPDWFTSVGALIEPKPIASLVDLWDLMFSKHAEMWRYAGSAPKDLKASMDELLELGKASSKSSKGSAALAAAIASKDDTTLLGIIRALHLKIHLKDLDEAAAKVERAPVPSKSAYDLLESKLIVHSCLQYLQEHGAEQFSTFINSTMLRLVSTAHPNETERSTNLRHYNVVLEKYIAWKKDLESIMDLPKFSPEYRIRRENLNQLRRTIKAEIEGVWQNNFRRASPIPVESEARRLLERYKTIFSAFPIFMKLAKHLVKEAFWLYKASELSRDPKWLSTFVRIYKHMGESRDSKLKAIKRTCAEMGLTDSIVVPRIHAPVLTFSSWKGGDRDGNPFVVASFSNEIFIEQKAFVLDEYVHLVETLVDSLTTSTEFSPVSDALIASVHKDRKTFPYISNIKPWEPYRAKMRYILEKLRNTQRLVQSVRQSAGSTTKPLLGRTLPGPAGYNTDQQLQDDVQVVYESLLLGGSKAQARSALQDLQILVNTFGLHLTSIDFRQHSAQNFKAVHEYLELNYHPMANKLKSGTEKERQAILLNIIGGLESCEGFQEFNPWVLPNMSKVSRDTWDTILVFQDAANTDPRAIGKFIISMCAHVSDILIILAMMKIVGSLESSGGVITKCDLDVTGLFETVEDLKAAPTIIHDLLSIKMIRDYITQFRNGKVTMMMGYSDSVRDGSSLASDAQIVKTSLQLSSLEQDLNRTYPSPSQKHSPIKFVFYRGRGDTIPRGFGGSVTKAVGAQLITTQEEDLTEQNRFLRRYSSVSSTIDHLHSLYSAHVGRQVAKKPADALRYQRYFDFFGRISNVKWCQLVRPDGLGDAYFSILSKYSILPHLPKAHFASRPVARDGVTYNIDSIRAIPFTMFLAQMREFTNAYYGTGTAFEEGSRLLSNENAETTLTLLAAYDKIVSKEGWDALNVSKDTRVPSLNLLLEKYISANESSSITSLLAAARAFSDSTPTPSPLTIVEGVLDLYHPVVPGIEEIAKLVLDLQNSGQTVMEVLREMYRSYAPFQYSIQNKEAALLIRSSRIVNMYTERATAEEKSILEMTHRESVLTTTWILGILEQEELQSKTLTQDFNSPELEVLHHIQARWLTVAKDFVPGTRSKLVDERKIGIYIQMSILAISEALGFAG
jgi:phosphoenolpyruvate carboxylase